MIRIAKPSEIEKINDIRKQVQQLHSNGRPDIFRNDFCKELFDSIYQYFREDDKTALVCVRNDEIYGFALLHYLDMQKSPYKVARRILNIDEIGVDADKRRQGAGTELMDYIKKIKVEENFDALNLDMWEFNSNALKFYESVGFTTYRRYMEL